MRHHPWPEQETHLPDKGGALLQEADPNPSLGGCEQTNPYKDKTRRDEMITNGG